MSPKARIALRTIHRCIRNERYSLSLHFTERMDQRGLFWPDVLAVIETPHEMRSAGLDEHDRPKWIISGTTADDLAIELVCVLELDHEGDFTLFITIYWD